MHTIHPKCDISNFQYYLGQIVCTRVDSMHIGALLLNELTVRTNQLNE